MSMKLLKNNSTFSLHVVLRFLGAWCVFSQSITFAADISPQNDDGSWLLELVSSISTFVGGLILPFISGFILSFLSGAVRESVDKAIILVIGDAAILSGRAHNIYALNGKIIKDGVVQSVENEFSSIFPKHGVIEAEEYRLKDIVLSTGWKRARINGMLEGLKDNKFIWDAQIIGRGRYVKTGEHVLQGAFYLQCEFKSIPTTKNSNQKVLETWQATYVFRNTDATHFEGYWLLYDAHTSARAGFGTLDLTLEERLSFLKRLSKLFERALNYLCISKRKF